MGRISDSYVNNNINSHKCSAVSSSPSAVSTERPRCAKCPTRLPPERAPRARKLPARARAARALALRAARCAPRSSVRALASALRALRPARRLARRPTRASPAASPAARSRPAHHTLAPCNSRHGSVRFTHRLLIRRPAQPSSCVTRSEGRQATLAHSRRAGGRQIAQKQMRQRCGCNEGWRAGGSCAGARERERACGTP
jgi:hypothetical protein